MSQLESFKGVKPWNLDTDRKFLEAISQSTDTTYNGIKGALESLRDLEKKTEDCFIHLKHAVNWVNSLNYTRFIENKIQLVAEKEEVQEVPVVTPHSELSSEQLAEKYRKAIGIAIADLNLQDIKADDNGGQMESGTMDGMTMAASGNFITAQLKGRIPFLIGSKEFGMSPYIGLEVGVSSSLTEDNLNDLKGEEENKGSAPEKVEDDPQKAYVAMTAAVEEVKAAESARKAGTSSYLDSYSSNSSKLFGIAGADDEDEVLPQYKDQQDEVPVPPDIDIPMPPPLDVPLPPEIDVPEPPPLLPEEEPSLPPDDDKKEENLTSSSLFANQEPTEDFNTIQARATEKAEPKEDYKQRMNKLFGLEEDDEEDEEPKETTESLIGLYRGKSTNLFGNSDPSKSQSKPPPAVSKTVVLPPQDTEQKLLPKKVANFLVDDDDEDLASSNTKKGGSGNGLFSDD